MIKVMLTIKSMLMIKAMMVIKGMVTMKVMMKTGEMTMMAVLRKRGVAHATQPATRLDTPGPTNETTWGVPY